jgi:acyl-CoA synthetase (AMP-forming)/AMP-acid ligase II
VTLAEVYDRLADRRPGEPALRFVRPPHVGVVITWRQLAERADGIALRGIPRGGRCAVVLADHPDLLPTLVAVWRLGGIVVPVDPQWGTALTARVVRHSRADAVIDVTAGTVSPTRGRDRHDTVPVPPGTALISYTSGSTADPKGVVLGHRQLLSAYTRAASAISARYGRVPARVGCAMRMSGLGVLGMHYLWPAVFGAEVVVLPELTLATARDHWAVCSAHGVDLTYLVPPLVELVRRAASPPTSSARRPLCLSGGAPLRPSAQQRFQERFGVVLLNAYGLTEVSFAAFFGDWNSEGWGTPSIGRPVTCSARLVGADGVLTGPAEGELELAGDVTCDGYLGNPEATAGLLHDDWLRTGDFARRDEQGRYWIVGRTKETALKGAFTVYLSEVEEAACELRGVAEAAAVRIDLPSGGEDIGLVVAGDCAGGTTFLDAVSAGLEQRLGRDRTPRRVVHSSQPLPRVGQGKIDRRQLSDLWRRLTEGQR